jgi:hypothetical protein
MSKRLAAVALADDEPIMLSVPVPRSALMVVAPPPELLSQKNVEQVVGIPAETYLRALRREGCPLKIIADGKLRLVNRMAFLAWYQDSGAPPKRQETPAGGDDVAALEAKYQIKQVK